MEGLSMLGKEMAVVVIGKEGEWGSVLNHKSK